MSPSELAEDFLVASGSNKDEYGGYTVEDFDLLRKPVPLV
jgi:hypothetical protein